MPQRPGAELPPLAHDKKNLGKGRTPSPGLLGKEVLDVTKEENGETSDKGEENKTSDGDSCPPQEEKTSSSESHDSTTA
ncbi:hypothetical protein RUND412_008071 [Rhizina undulata]